VTPHSSMRSAIARHLTESKQQIPHFYLKADCTVDNLLALRREINAAARRKISVNDLVIKAVGLAFARLPEANVGWTDEGTARYAQSDICVAVSTGDGLLTPVVRDVAGRSLTSVSEDIADLAERSRAGRLKQAELEGGTFTVSNLGMHGVTEFSAIINPPQAGILAVGAATQRAVVKDGELGVATVMTVTLSADHRVLDGELGARWLAVFVGLLESPMQLLI
ncbi:2-oxo acid dehydrogenase subunit E2, partial [Pasteurella multocida]|uniref:2-oxo acid dehydrogenase subunit E2 n=1 Tax=Pasteurella multocida TaxID=747 RepID=UPI002E9C8AD3|nr:2-oxo acid dehydrogenase subunit E2 [Pasteurella multocida]